MWEWCSRCGNPDPFARFKRFRIFAVATVFAFSLLLALLAHERNQSLDASAREFGRRMPHPLYLVLRAGD